MTSPRTDLAAFAAGLAARLTGTWTSEYQCHAQYADQFPRTEQLWDTGHVDYVVSQYVLTHDAVLHGPADQRLYVADRPRYLHQFLVAPLTPDSTHIKPHHFAGVEEPNGIAVPKDPARAAARVARRLLPRYVEALQAVLNNAAYQAQPPHRPQPPQVDQILTLTLYSDGALGAPDENVPVDARMTLYAFGFQYDPHQAAFLLPAAYGETGRALRVHAVVQQLTAKGIGVNLRQSAPTTRAALPAAAKTMSPLHRKH
ncbi:MULTISPECIES: hypothetical protein [Streptomyces]|uniref:Uncharacterized protein n=1 Tax=Streptomyces doudnae TaxID=3075536 RepID=A0ABD5EVP2_9ACTN|nr:MULTISPECIES: hypothetical protein [unclassified Streptomyces]MDT0438718.1 hypothetical protein [Streptomyces sp. DSM 41981]MYQ61965.1 hypothetical protein [Streptomyces sp. SID4950]SCD27823.1 hypothetical protein GA0115242_10056 [Streptomyces sp. SolWspMP-5a-2]